ncbi:DNA repair protein RecO, partial [Candidatus Dojkabacteria bacterium]|nr:DNA repair protein RecO [Candidatus Dojkabacteria bacterium]
VILSLTKYDYCIKTHSTSPFVNLSVTIAPGMAITKYQNITGIIFRMFDAQEADRVVHILTNDGSRLPVFARGVRKATSRKAHAIDLLNKVECKLVGTGSLSTVTEVKLLSQHGQFKRNYPLLMLSQLICEVIDIFAAEDQEEAGYYRNLENLLALQRPGRPILLAAAFILRYLYVSGHLPKLDSDVLSGEKLDIDNAYILMEPGYTSDSAKSSDRTIAPRLLKTQKFILQSDFAHIDKLALAKEEQLELFHLHRGWLEVVTDRELRSAQLFLEAS